MCLNERDPRGPICSDLFVKSSILGIILMTLITIQADVNSLLNMYETAFVR